MDDLHYHGSDSVQFQAFSVVFLKLCYNKLTDGVSNVVMIANVS